MQRLTRSVCFFYLRLEAGTARTIRAPGYVGVGSIAARTSSRIFSEAGQ